MLLAWQPPSFFKILRKWTSKAKTEVLSYSKCWVFDKASSTNNSISLNERNSVLNYSPDFSSRITDQTVKTIKLIGHNQGEFLSSDLVIWFFNLHFTKKTALTFTRLMASSAGCSQRYRHHSVMCSTNEYKSLLHSFQSSPHDFKRRETNFSKRVTNFLSDFNLRMIL